MHILLTNDDSHVSPLFRFAIDTLKTLGRVTIVVPKEEQSWTGKSMSRFKPLYLDEIRLGDDDAFCLDGTPADCINVGIHHVCATPPDVIVSGINIGINTGIGFFFASGTIGACLEANIAGIPAVALSQSLDSALFQAWMQDRHMPQEAIQRLESQTTVLLTKIFPCLWGRDDFFRNPVTWNVNLPYMAASDWSIVQTVLGHNMYGSCFNKIGDQFRHELRLSEPDVRDQADGTVVQRGHVSVTYVDIRELGQNLVSL